MNQFRLIGGVISMLCLIQLAQSAFAETLQEPASDKYQSCLLQRLDRANDNMTVEEIRKACQAIKAPMVDKVDAQKPQIILSGSSNRFLDERKTQLNPYVLTPHKMNYVLPAITTNRINREAYESINSYAENLAEVEAKFQVSLKVPLNTGDLLFENDALYVGFTLEAWWQVHSENISKPFRETNYQPELFYLTPLAWRPFGANTGIIVGLEHQSNGRGLELSRSWNRMYAQFLFEKDKLLFSFRPWVRLSEDDKKFELDPDGDDNPDIEDYLGQFELGVAYKWRNLEFSFKGRQNFRTKFGSGEFGITFPLFGKVRGFAMVFKGYGESLIDYNYHQTRYGIGVTFNNML